MKASAENIFFIESPLQLLNALEAKDYFKLENNHLLIHAGGTGFAVEGFLPILAEQEWAEIRYIYLNGKTFDFTSRLLGKRLSHKVRGYCYDYQQRQNIAIIEKIARQYGAVKNIFLGNYLEGSVEYMRHFANRLKHDNLYLLDDGTDSLLINDARSKPHYETNQQNETKSLIERMKTTIRKVLFDFEWDVKDAESVIFFSAFELSPSGKDRLIRNRFERIRKNLAREITPYRDVLFLGQCLVEDGCLPEEDYLQLLSRIKEYFVGERIVYVPHPRESVLMIDKIRDTLEFEIRRPGVPIEIEVSIGGRQPGILAGFFTSALVNCHLILTSQTKLIAFYIPPESMDRDRELSSRVYEYLQCRADDNLKVVSSY